MRKQTTAAWNAGPQRRFAPQCNVFCAGYREWAWCC